MYNPPPRSTYKISVVIAMYNTEKYIGECLESFLAQTFQDFEVVVIDDCSTDSSATIVESYAEKFNGRLRLTRTKKNSGNNGIPNNLGLALSYGEYVLFMDSDDAVTPDALEKLYVVAKDFNADVVGCEKYYDVPEKFWYDAEFRKELKPFSYQSGEFVTEPTPITNDFSERVKDCYHGRFLWNIWSKLIRREFLIENGISITNEMANDMLLTCFVVYSAERYVRAPYVINFYRVVESSLTHKKREPIKQLQKYFHALKVGFAHLDKFLNDRDFFKQHPEMKYLALETYVREILSYFRDIYSRIPAPAFDEVLRKEFGGDNAALMAFIFSTLNIQRLQLMQAQYQINQIVNQANRQANQFNQFAAQAQEHIAELRNELKRLNGKE